MSPLFGPQFQGRTTETQAGWFVHKAPRERPAKYTQIYPNNIQQDFLLGGCSNMFRNMFRNMILGVALRTSKF